MSQHLQLGQTITRQDIRQLPPGSVVTTRWGERITRLHDGWLYSSRSTDFQDTPIKLESQLHVLPGTLDRLPVP